MQIEKRVLAGTLIRIKNKDKKRFSNAKDTYYAVWVEDANGKNERCLLFTENEINKIRARSSKNPISHTRLDTKVDNCKVVFGRLILIKNKDIKPFSNKTYLAVWVDVDGFSRCFLLTGYEIKRAEYRASRNKEDLTKKHWLVNLLD